MDQNRSLIFTNKQLNHLAFWLVATLCILNLNAPMRALLNVSRPLSLLILFGCIIGLLTNRYRPTLVVNKTGMWYLICITLFLLVGGLGSDYGIDVLEGVINYGVGILLIFCSAVSGFYSARDGEQQRFLFKLYLIFLISTCSVFFSDYLLEYGLIEYRSEFRRSGFFPEPNEAGQIGCMTQAIGFALMRSTRKRFPIFLLSGVLLSYLAIFYTYSRASIITSVLLTISQLFFLRESRYFKAIAAFITALLLAAIFWLFTQGIERLDLSFNAARRLDTTRALVMDQQISAETTGSRLLLFQVSIDKTLDSPVFGNGLGSLTPIKEIGLGCHNSVLLIFGESGVLVGLMFVMVLGHWAWTGLQNRDRVLKSLMVNYLLVLFMAMMVSHTVLQRRFHNILTGLCFGLAAGAAYRDTRQKQTERLDLNREPGNNLPPVYHIPAGTGVVR